MKTAIITGITGQDGAYLTQLLLQHNYTVVGVVRKANLYNKSKLEYLNVFDHIKIVACNLENAIEVNALINTYQPTEVYNLAAQSSVSQSFQLPQETLQFNILSVVNLLEAIRLSNTGIKFYQASSSEMFGRVNQLPITENSLLHPLSPYAISKVAAHHTTINYRESYNMYACCGVLFNHESYLRQESFFIKKLLIGALDIVNGKKECIEFGNLNIKRDFGFSKDYVQAMWLMLQQPKPDDFLICSGTSILLSSIVNYVFTQLNIPLHKIKINPQLYRPTEIEDIYGSNKKAIDVLGWKANFDFYKVLDNLIAEEQQHYAK